MGDYLDASIAGLASEIIPTGILPSTVMPETTVSPKGQTDYAESSANEKTYLTRSTIADKLRYLKSPENEFSAAETEKYMQGLGDEILCGVLSADGVGRIRGLREYNAIAGIWGLEPKDGKDSQKVYRLVLKEGTPEYYSLTEALLDMGFVDQNAFRHPAMEYALVLEDMLSARGYGPKRVLNEFLDAVPYDLLETVPETDLVKHYRKIHETSGYGSLVKAYHENRIFLGPKDLPLKESEGTLAEINHEMPATSLTASG